MKATHLRAQTPPRQTAKYIKLKGVDMSADPSQIGQDFSPWCPNLISDNGGNPEKRPGWRTVFTLDGPVNGLWHGRIGSDLYFFAHAGSKLYAWRPLASAPSSGSEASQGLPPGSTPLLIRSGLRNGKGSGFIMNEKFWLLTGSEYIVYGLFSDNEETNSSASKDDIPPADEDKQNDLSAKKLRCKNVSEIAYVPTVVIARSPTGGGTPYENINLLGAKQKNRFLTTSATVYQLSATNLKSVDKVVCNDAVKSPGTDYTVDLVKGTVTFKTAPPAPPVTGRDNLVITFSKEYEGYAGRIQKCTIAAGYGYGSNDRIFFAGNPDRRNTDWFSGLNDPSYVADLNYSKVGGEETAIMGYHRLGEFLAVVNEENQQDSTIFLRSAQVASSGSASAAAGAVFPLLQGIAGVGAVSPYAFATLKDEPLFLSRTGIYAITSNVITAERTLRGRSYFIDAQLTKEPDLKNACSVEWNGYYVLAVNNKAYILDGNSVKENTRQFSSDYCYRCYHWDNIPAVALMEHDGDLWFGSADGRICRFNTDINGIYKYNDDGKPIVAQWATKADDDGDFMLRKTLIKKGSGVMIKPYMRSSVRVLVRSDKECFPRLIKYSTMDIWNWEDIDFNRLEFSSNDAPRVVPFNTKIKKYITLQIIVENNALNEGFGVYGIIKRYIVGNYVKS